MPLLDATALAALFDEQKRAARVDSHCPHCTAQTWPNYCRQCDDFFTDGPYIGCPDGTLHQKENHPRY